MLDSEIDVAMKLYSPREATEKAEKIKAKGGLVKWMKNRYKYKRSIRDIRD